MDRYASRPPGNLTSALAAAVQSYEAACDSLEQELVSKYQVFLSLGRERCPDDWNKRSKQMLAKAVILRDFDADKATQRVKQEEEAGIEERQMQRGGADATTEGAATERGDGDDAAKTAQNLKREDEETGKQADSQKGQDARTGEPTAAMMIDLTDSPRAKGDEQGQVQTETKQGTTSSSNVIAIPDDDDDDMEDLFASKSNAHSSAIATPAATVAAASDPTSAKPQELLPSSDVEGVTHPAPAPATDVPAPDLMDDLPENLDFSSLSAEDFNALLANLGSSVDGLSGGAGSGTDMLAGFGEQYPFIPNFIIFRRSPVDNLGLQYSISHRSIDPARPLESAWRRRRWIYVAVEASERARRQLVVVVVSRSQREPAQFPCLRII